MSKPNIEPDCSTSPGGYQRSIAISLKRIADALAGDGDRKMGVVHFMAEEAADRRGH